MTLSIPEFVPEGTTRPLHGGTDRNLILKARQASFRGGAYRRVFKRFFDILAVLAAAPLIVPVVLLLGLLVRWDGGPAFYSQLRLGKGGRVFRMWKLRTMVIDADARLAACLKADTVARLEWETTQKLRRDPRITRFGHFLRRSSLDELPQLWNVLTGEMSLVGPRPMMPSQQPLYPGSAYFLIRPGITGHWQTAGRNSTSFSARADYDEAYEATLSLPVDLRILARTVGVVMKGTGC